MPGLTIFALCVLSGTKQNGGVVLRDTTPTGLRARILHVGKVVLGETRIGAARKYWGRSDSGAPFEEVWDVPGKNYWLLAAHSYIKFPGLRHKDVIFRLNLKRNDEGDKSDHKLDFIAKNFEGNRLFNRGVLSLTREEARRRLRSFGLTPVDQFRSVPKGYGSIGAQLFGYIVGSRRLDFQVSYVFEGEKMNEAILFCLPPGEMQRIDPNMVQFVYGKR